MTRRQNTRGNTKTLAQAAVAYAAAGFAVLPLRPGTKEPHTKHGKDDASKDVDEVRQWWDKHPNDNIGLRPSEGQYVIDVESVAGHDVDGFATLAELVDELGSLPDDAPRVSTAAGGQHIWLSYDGGPLDGKLGDGIDVKSHNGYVVAPPSIIGNKRYRWLTPMTAQPPQAPPAWREHARKSGPNCRLKRNGHSVAVGIPNHPWIDAALDRELDELARCPESGGEYGGRNRTLNAVALRAARLLLNVEPTPGVERERLRDRLIDACDANALVADDGLKSVHATINSAFSAADREGPAGMPTPDPSTGDSEPNTPTETELADIENGFWQSRPSLRAIYDAALGRMCSPWAVLAICAARALALVRPCVTLPPLVGGPGSLNFFAAIAAPSGGGKDAAAAVARELVPHFIFERNLGSGEGLVDAYHRPADKETGEPAGLRESVMFLADEIDTLAAMGNRAGSTTLPILRSAFSGNTIGFSYRSNPRQVQAQTYRMTLVVSVQPARSGTLLDDHGGGTPQRFMWFPGVDSRIVADAPEWVAAPLSLDIDARAYPVELQVPHEAQALIREERAKNQRGEQDALDSHALFVREKFAYALAVLDNRDHMTSEDWELAGVAMKVSDRTRGWVAKLKDQAAFDDAMRQGTVDGARRFAAGQEQAQRETNSRNRIAKGIITKLTAAGPEGVTESVLKREAKSTDRPRISSILESLAERQRVSKIDRKPGDRTDRWALAGHASANRF